MTELFYFSRAGVKPQMLRGLTFRPGEMINFGLPVRTLPPPPQVPIVSAIERYFFNLAMSRIPA